MRLLSKLVKQAWPDRLSARPLRPHWFLVQRCRVEFDVQGTFEDQPADAAEAARAQRASTDVPQRHTGVKVEPKAKRLTVARLDLTPSMTKHGQYVG
jgi:hypothetical protein